MISQTNVPIMQKAVRVIYDMSEDTETRELIREREKAMFDEASALGSARREGIAEGIAKGRAEGEAKGIAKGKAEGRAERDAEIIAMMRASGMSDEQIDKIFRGKK